MIKSITSVSKPFPDGQRVVAAAIEFDSAFAAKDLKPSFFSVEGRNVTDVYVSDSADGAAKDCGCFVIVCLDPKDAKSATLKDQSGKLLSEPEEPHKDPVMHGGPPMCRFPDGRIFQGPMGLRCTRDAIVLKVQLLNDIVSVNGDVENAWDLPVISTIEINELADLFEVRELDGMKYNIFIPENYDPSKKYPLLLFIHDAGKSADNPKVTLEQGMGATIFASKEEQDKHPCFIIAPQHSGFLPIANDKYWCTDEEFTIKKIVDMVISDYSVDTDRLYTTGQSMGFMTSIQLMLDFPGFFTAALLPAGHWDIEKTATLWDQKIWMFLSDEDGGGQRMIAALPGAIHKIGGKIAVYRWDANVPTAEMSRLVGEHKNDDCSFHLTIFPGDSINRPDQIDRTNGGGHAGTWHFVYMIEQARNWLFEQSK